jgi:hypothetical protein
MKTEDFLWWTEFRKVKRGYVDHYEYERICEIHADIYEHKLEYVTKCGDCGAVQLYIDEINKKYLELTL